MENRDRVHVQYFDPERGGRAAARLRWRRRGMAAAAVLLFAAVCAAALGLSSVGHRPDAGGNSGPVAEDGPAPEKEPVSPPEEVIEQGCCPAGRFEFEDALAELLEANPEARNYVDGFQGVTEPDPELDLSGELTPGVIPYLSQLDPRWGYCRYDTGLIGWTGCGPTALSMVAMGLSGDGTLTPSYVAGLATSEGYCVPGDGTAWLFFSEGAALLGLRAKELPLWEPTMRAELDAGRPIICIMGPGHFTSSGHYIVITGCDNQGYHVLDPARLTNCGVWTWEDISGEIRNLWSYELAE